MKKLEKHSFSFLLKTASIVLICFSLASCALTSRTASVEVDYIGRDAFVLAKPLAVDIKIENRKIDGTATVQNKKYKKNRAVALQEAKKMAVIEAIKRGDADIIIQPIFETHSNNRTTTASVSGFAAKYKDFREITASDTTAFLLRERMGATSMVTSFAAPTEVAAVQKKKRRAGKIILAVVGVAATAALIGVATTAQTEPY